MAHLVSRIAELEVRVKELETLLEEEREKSKKLGELYVEELLNHVSTDASTDASTDDTINHWVWPINGGWVSVIADTKENAQKLIIEEFEKLKIEHNGNGTELFNDDNNVFTDCNNINYFEDGRNRCRKFPSLEDILNTLNDEDWNKRPIMFSKGHVNVFCYGNS